MTPPNPAPPAQPTPGPWSVTSVIDDDDSVLICANDKLANGQWEIATPHGPDAKANAELIARAPEIPALESQLAAYRAAAQKVSSVWNNHEYKSGSLWIKAMGEAIAALHESAKDKRP